MNDSNCELFEGAPDAKKPRLWSISRITEVATIAAMLALAYFLVLYPDRHIYWPCEASSITVGMTYAELLDTVGCEPGVYTADTSTQQWYHGAALGEFHLPTEATARVVLWQFQNFAYLVHLDCNDVVIGKSLYWADNQIWSASIIARRLTCRILGPTRFRVRE